MSDLIEPKLIPDGAVYGVRQYSYTVDGRDGMDYIAALAAASFKDSVAIEAAASSYAAVIRQRQKKVSDLGYALAQINWCMATMDPKSNDPDKKSSANVDLPKAVSLLNQYGISISVTDGNKLTYRNASTAQNNIQYALDVENNNLQQDTVSLQSMITKRDNSYSTAARIVKKADNAASKTISNIGS